MKTAAIQAPKPAQPVSPKGKAPDAAEQTKILTPGARKLPQDIDDGAETAVIEPRRRRRLTPHQKRVLAAEKQRAWRAAVKAEQNQALPEQQPAGTAGEESPPAIPVPAESTAPQRDASADKAATLAVALAGTLEMTTRAVAVAYCGEGAPGMPHDDCVAIAQLWGPLLAPYMNDDTAEWMKWIIAGTATAGAGLSWRAELMRFKAVHPKPIEAKVEARDPTAA